MVDLINACIVLLNYIFIPALSYGSQLALGALGVSFIYAILRFANFSHGDLMSFGAMMTILFTWLLAIIWYLFWISPHSNTCSTFSYFCNYFILSSY